MLVDRETLCGRFADTPDNGKSTAFEALRMSHFTGPVPAAVYTNEC